MNDSQSYSRRSCRVDHGRVSCDQEAARGHDDGVKVQGEHGGHPEESGDLLREVA